jgi:hypothetical protein
LRTRTTRFETIKKLNFHLDLSRSPVCLTRASLKKQTKKTAVDPVSQTMQAILKDST